jgi:hypothetical protein
MLSCFLVKLLTASKSSYIMGSMIFVILDWVSFLAYPNLLGLKALLLFLLHPSFSLFFCEFFYGFVLVFNYNIF